MALGSRPRKVGTLQVGDRGIAIGGPAIGLRFVFLELK
jgi:hypothetical protein